jgi:flagellar motor switch protein FliG
MTSATSSERTRSLNGPESVAALLLSVDKSIAQNILKHFDQSELRQIAILAAGLGSVPASTMEPLIDEFIDQFMNGRANLLGSAGEAEQLLTGVIPAEQIAEIMSDVLGSSNNVVWDRLSNVSDKVLANYLLNQHPQTAALILSKIDPSLAAKILAQTPRDVSHALMRRMLAARPAPDSAMRILEASLQEDLLQNVAIKAAAATNMRMAAILNKMEHEQREVTLDALSQSRPKETEALKNLLFTFEDVVNLSARARMIVFDQVAADRVVMALHGADPTIRDSVLTSLSARVRRMVESELATDVSPPRRDILQARRTISDLVLKLVEQGKIELGNSEDEAGD